MSLRRRRDIKAGAVPAEPRGTDVGSEEQEQNGACPFKRKGSLEPSLSLWNLYRRW